MRTSRLLQHASRGPWGDSAFHLSSEALARGFAALTPPKDSGELALIVARADDGERHTPDRARLTPEAGVPGDAWQHDCPEKIDAQITVMRTDVARLMANGQPLTLFGDNLLVDLDLSVGNLPTGTRLRLGGALLEVTPEPHTGCKKFHQRFGADALRFTATKENRDFRLRGIYVKVVEPGEIRVGDMMEVVSRGPAAASSHDDER